MERRYTVKQPFRDSYFCKTLVSGGSGILKSAAVSLSERFSQNCSQIYGKYLLGSSFWVTLETLIIILDKIL